MEEKTLRYLLSTYNGYLLGILLEKENEKILPEVKGKLNQIWNMLVPLQQTGEEVRRLRTIMENDKSLRPKFLESSPGIRTYSHTIENIIRSPAGPLEHDLYITGYFDQETLDKLLPVARFVNLISPGPYGNLHRRNKDALKRISEAGAKVRIHPMLHARIFCVPDLRQLIVGSGDLQSDCFGGRRFDIGIWSNYPELIESAVDFFNRVWEESDPLPETSA